MPSNPGGMTELFSGMRDVLLSTNALTQAEQAADAPPTPPSPRPPKRSAKPPQAPSQPQTAHEVYGAQSGPASGSELEGPYAEIKRQIEGNM